MKESITGQSIEMIQYKNKPIHYLYFGEVIPGQRPRRCMTMKVALCGHTQCVRVVKHNLTIYRQGHPITFDQFKEEVPYNHPRMDPITGVTLKEITRFDGHFTTSNGLHLNGPIELIIDLKGVEYRIKSRFAKLM